MAWLLLTPPGVTVEVRTSGAITEPILVTAEQIQAAALAAARHIEAGLDVNVGQLLTELCRPGKDPAQQEMALEAAPSFFDCTCGNFYTSELKLREHQRGCGAHASSQIPSDRRVD